MILSATAQRVSTTHLVDPVNYYRHLFAYCEAASIVEGNVIEIGCGDGYGIDLLIDHCHHYVAVDKRKGPLSSSTKKSFDYFRMILPSLKNIPSNIFDFAVSFQVVEHIKKDDMFLQEIYRVLKPGGTLLLTTPNRLRSVSRNPWHVREYTANELATLFAGIFSDTKLYGIYADELLEQYFADNKARVEKFARWDVFKLAHRLPRRLLQMPYDLLNAVYKKNLSYKASWMNVNLNNFYRAEINDNCIDLFVMAKKYSY
jgi:SAM-dependent methyltransferase